MSVPSLQALFNSENHVSTSVIAEALAAGANPSECDSEGTPASLFVLHYSTPEALSLLLESGGILVTDDESGQWGPLGAAIYKEGRATDLVKILLDHGVDPLTEHEPLCDPDDPPNPMNRPDCISGSPLHDAAGQGLAEACRMLLAHGAAPLLALFEESE